MLIFALAGLAWLLVRQQKQARELLEQQAVTLRAVQLRQLDLVDKAFALLRAAGPWEFQQVQAMNQAAVYDEAYDPSPEAEADRIAERRNKLDEQQEALSGAERDILGDLFPGSF